MPFSFIDIEESKTRLIGWVFVFILLFYFLTAYLVMVVLENFFFGYFSLHHFIFAFGLALTAALIHWSMSTANLIPKMTLAVGALEIDRQDSYHQFLQNIVDEVCVAIGGRKIEAMVIPSASCNAFALEDFKGRSVIGVTEGLLARLNRQQLEAVVAHEAGHIVSRDSVTTTVVASLAELYQESLEGVGRGLSRSRSRGSLPLLFIYLILGMMNFLSSLLRYFISRQREFRADAIAVRLTRDPLSLAEALSLLSTHWRGEGAVGEKLESIFIVNPRYSQLDEKEGVWADIFSTHPPINQRIKILLEMAHLNEYVLEEKIKHFKRLSPVANIEPAAAASTVNKLKCPNCLVNLKEEEYEGVPVLKCEDCAGTFLEQQKVSRILIREDKDFPDEVVQLAKTAIAGKEKTFLKKSEGKQLWVLTCPKCGRKMHRQFFVYSYPVEIDRCYYCAGVWFDKSELEVLQYIYQHKEKTNGDL
ncbi:MAG: M48 family metalloprotease [Candidatus Omnitrophota bacterium]